MTAATHRYDCCNNGVKGFLKKDIEPSESDLLSAFLFNRAFIIHKMYLARWLNCSEMAIVIQWALEQAMLPYRKSFFLKLASGELTYKEIALEMKLNPRAVDDLRDHLFEKLEIKGRVCFAMYAIRQGIVAFKIKEKRKEKKNKLVYQLIAHTVHNKTSYGFGAYFCFHILAYRLHCTRA
jgi:DNA-binding NarL/FixJ family response regulator